jgi:hypothetical protein
MPKSPELGLLLAAGYGMTIERARDVITERKKDPSSHSFEELRKAEAMLEAFNAAPKPTSKRQPFKRPPAHTRD